MNVSFQTVATKKFILGCLCAFAFSVLISICFHSHSEAVPQVLAVAETTSELAKSISNDEWNISTKTFDCALLDNGETPEEYLRTGFKHGISYLDVRKKLRHEDLPKLYEMLEDVSNAGHWHQTAEVIAYLSNKGDSASVDALLNYVRRKDDWQKVPEKERWFEAMGKIRAVSWIGRLGDQKSHALLRLALTREGATELGKKWLAESLPAPWDHEPEQAIANLRGYAAIGLVYSGVSENVELVEKAYQKEHEASQTSKKIDNWYNGLVTAMAERDLIAKFGMEERLALIGDGEKATDALSPYIHKHAWYLQKKPTERTEK